ncbi:MAG TPA: ABC transporter substrate-binding protein [bacterium]|nr:ABC transporter substrate-binding protein [bacterium]
MERRKLYLSTLFILSLSLIVRLSAATAAENLSKLRVGYPSQTGNRAPLWTAKEKGFFKKYGLDVDLLLIRSGTITTTTLLSGEIDLAANNPQGLLSAILQGGDLVIVGSAGDSIPFKLLVHPSITKPEDLKGKKIAITRPGALIDTIARSLLEKLGVKPDKDVVLISVGDLATQDAAFASGSVEGTVETEDNILAGYPQLKYNVLGSAADLGINFVGHLFAVRKSFAKEHHSKLVAFLSAYTEAMHYAKTRPEQTKEIMGKYLKTQDQRILDINYKNYILENPHRLASPDRSDIEPVLEQMYRRDPKLKKVDVGEITDGRFAAEVEASGLLKTLYGN